MIGAPPGGAALRRVASAIFLLAGSAASAQEPPRLLEARVSVQLDAEAARVQAIYELEGAPGELELRALRPPRQRLRPVGPTSAGSAPSGGVERLPGSYRWVARPRVADREEGGRSRLRLAYVVTGTLDRVPVFVPAVPAAPGETRIELRIRGRPGGSRDPGGFPRFARTDEGQLLARPDNLPSFVRLPSRLGRTLDRAAEAAVALLLLAGAGGWWALRARGRRRSLRRSRDP